MGLVSDDQDYLQMVKPGQLFLVEPGHLRVAIKEAALQTGLSQGSIVATAMIRQSTCWRLILPQPL